MVAEGPAAEGPAAEGPAAEGPAAEGPAAEGPAADSRPYTLANIWLNTRERAKSQPARR